MTDIQIATIVLLGLITPIVLVAVPLIFFMRRMNNKREAENTCPVWACVVDIERRGSHSIYNAIDTYYNFYTVRYIFGGVEYTAGLGEVISRPKVGDTIKIWINPEKPNQPCADGAIENTKKGVKRAVVVCIAICGWFIAITLGAVLMSML